MSVGTATAIAIGVGAAASVGSAAIGAHAAGKAADQQAQSADKALGFQHEVFDKQQENQHPYLEAGKTSINKLMEDLDNGTFGPGSNPTFKAPTLDEARATPGYQFAQQQGMRAVDASAAARGGSMSGGAVRSAAQFGTGLADSTYSNVFNRSLSTYQAGLSKQAQEFSQLYQPASLGENAAANAGNTSQQVAGNVGNLMTQVGNAQAAGTVGSANAISGGLNGVANSTMQGVLMDKFLGGMGAGMPSSAIGNGGAPIPSSYGADGTPIYIEAGF